MEFTFQVLWLSGFVNSLFKIPNSNTYSSFLWRPYFSCHNSCFVNYGWYYCLLIYFICNFLQPSRIRSPGQSIFFCQHIKWDLGSHVVSETHRRNRVTTDPGLRQKLFFWYIIQEQFSQLAQQYSQIQQLHTSKWHLKNFLFTTGIAGIITFNDTCKKVIVFIRLGF